MPIPRRIVLQKRLIEFCKAASLEELPFNVVQILGFGSFFRGKESPKDVDLVLRVDRRPERFALFCELVKKVRFTSDYEKAFPSPCQAMLHESTSEVPASKWPVGQRERLTSLYSQWLEAYTWNMLHPHNDADHFALIGPDNFARRLIRRRFPKLNIIEILDEAAEPHIPLHIFHGFEVTVWTKESPDAAATLGTLLADDAVRQNVIKEVIHFRLHRRSIMDQIDLCREEIAVLQDQAVPPPARDGTDVAEWHAGVPRLAHAAAASKQSYSASVAFRTSGIINPDTFRTTNATDTRTLIAEADDVRTAIKVLQEDLEQWSELKEQLCCARHGPNVGAVPLDELAAALMLNHGPSLLRPRKLSFLNQQGFSIPIVIDDTLLRASRGY